MHTFYLTLAALGCLLQAQAFFLLTPGAISSPCSGSGTRLGAAADDSRPSYEEQVQAIASETQARIGSMVQENKVMLFMKGNKLFPQCGFSNSAVQILRAVDASFETFDVLTDPDVREGVKQFSEWPTIPQLYVEGEFIGGS
ncbi:unnamed protein product, partial [Chrysoparadoxa australica]